MSSDLYYRWRSWIEPKNGSETLDSRQNSSRIDFVAWVTGTWLKKVFGQPKKSHVPEMVKRMKICLKSCLKVFLTLGLGLTPSLVKTWVCLCPFNYKKRVKVRD